ncbi:hypothetical protein EW142_02110 [Flagellimonas allohymeniacidonis]|uniref:DUF1772 domain-containing protein n=1 Tax=Flagellimonas allohymeniacidonis TaxID=2517819 RepID=A0A4Q8QLS4_9FLAO|nr:hypothetical protein EW142_02110 [Allomuricauda hymeniacidonis]
MSLANLIFDSGTLVLVWLVQLVIYPSFAYYQKNDLIRWHRSYTKRVTYVVLPLMLGQLILCFFSIYLEVNIATLARLVMVLALWLTTFMVFVPLHSKIEESHQTDTIITKLKMKNWLRTALWTLLFLINFAD